MSRPEPAARETSGTAAAPARRSGGRRVGLPTVVLVLATTLLVVASAWTLTPDRGLRDHYLAADGWSGPATLSGVGGWAEQAVGSGQAIFGAGPVGIGLTAEHDQQWIYRTQLARTLVRTPEDSVQLLLSVTDDRLALESVASSRLGLLSAPAITLSDDRVDDRDHWTADATVAYTGAQYAETTVDVEARDLTGADDGCRNWQILFTSDGRPDYELGLTMCPGRGVTRLDLAAGDDGTLALQTGGPWQPSADTGQASNPIPSWSELTRWQPSATEITGRDGLTSAPVFSATDLAPAFTASGRMVLATRVDQNLTAVDLGRTPTVGWRVHPGGVPTELITAGELTLVATSQRQLIAYNRDGLPAWRTSTDELITGMQTSDGARVLLTLADGSVRALRVGDGSQLWEFDQQGRSDGLLATGDQLVAVGDAQGDVRVLEAATGRQLWSVSAAQDRSVAGLAVAGDTVAVLFSGRVEAFGPDGSLRWADTFTGTESGIAAVGTSVAYSSGAETRVADARTGAVQARLPAADQLVASAGVVLLLSAGSALPIGPGGRTADPWRLPYDPGSEPCSCAVGPEAAVFADVDKITVFG